MQFKPGDIAACYGNDWTSWAISCVTASVVAPKRLRWGPSHVAMICECNGSMTWVESTTMCRHPCRIHRTRVIGAQAHHPHLRVQDYVCSGGRVDVYRLTDANQLSQEEQSLLSEILIERFVKPKSSYDLAGALLSGTRAFQLTRLFPGADLHSLFCSEMVAAVVMRLNRMNHANPTRFNPARLLRTLVTTGKYQLAESLQPDSLPNVFPQIVHRSRS